MSNTPDNSFHADDPVDQPVPSPLPASQPHDAWPPGTPPLATATAAGEPPAGDASLASVIDTIEAIIIALVIALTFRAYIVEAFVIPTGSMAPTLLGAHYRVICPKCGYEFDFNADLHYQAQIDARGQLFIPTAADENPELISNSRVPYYNGPVICPNCREIISAEKFPQYLGTKTVMQQGSALRSFPFVWTNNGDRILVLKYLYAVMDPHRWDVIVFREPQEAKNNFIKRLIGLPGETVEIVNGDIYVSKTGGNDPEQRVIQRKPEAIQQNLWQLVYDNDYYPVDEGAPRPALDGAGDGAWSNPWVPASFEAAWKKGVVMTYGGNGPSGLHFNIRPAYAQSAAYTLNTLGYNNDVRETQLANTPRSVVGDLRLETLWTPATADARAIHLTLGRPNNCYQVNWSPDHLDLQHYNLDTGKFEPVRDASVGSITAPEAGKPYALVMNNVDHAIQFYINGVRLIAFEQPWNARQAAADFAQYPPDESLAPPPFGLVGAAPSRPDNWIRIDVGGPCTLGHLRLFRDLYYTQANMRLDPPAGKALMGFPVTLRKDEFFALGDNSRQSSDGRMWRAVYPALADLDVPAGVVPRRYLLGKAFFVYWPSGYRAAPEVPVLQDLPLIPDAGNMRIIR